MKKWPSIVGKNVRKFRLSRGLTQEQLAFASEIDLTYLGGIERGSRNPTITVLGRIADALGTPLADLIEEG